MNDSDVRLEALERAYVEAETKRRFVVDSITRGIRDLVCGTTDDDQELDRCEEICVAVVALALGQPEPLRSHSQARAAWEDRQAALDGENR